MQHSVYGENWSCVASYYVPECEMEVFHLFHFLPLHVFLSSVNCLRSATSGPSTTCS